MGKGSITADMGCFHTEETAFIDGCANDAVANLFIHGDGFACNALSSTAEEPSTILPSTGYSARAHHDDIPNGNLSTGISIFLAILHDGCHLGCQTISLLIASEVLPLERVSMYFPTVISVRIIAAPSRYSSMA